MHTSILQYFEKTCERFAKKIAISGDNTELTFEELSKMSSRVALKLLELNLQKNQPIAVIAGKKPSTIAVFLGIIKASCYYVPLDRAAPDARNNRIIENLNTNIVIIENKEDKINLNLSSNIQVLSLADLIRDEIVVDGFLKTREKNISLDPVYCIHTSGSTGIPKGVLISHAAVIDYINWAIETYDFQPDDVIGNQAPFIFDNSTLDIFVMLFTGATLNLIPEKLFKFPNELIEYLVDNDITSIFWVPSVLSNVARLRTFSTIQPKKLSKILFAGEIMPTKHLNYWRDAIPNGLFSNLYGPTEITVDCTYYILDRELQDHEPVPIGYACENMEILLLDGDKEVKRGDKGEICVRGIGVSLGYVNNKEKTDKSFCQNPLNTSYTDLIYRTGDTGYYNERGELIYVGRIDNQIKYMGYRIELGEIEAAILSETPVQNTCVVLGKNGKLTAYYLGEFNVNELRQSIKRLLPKYMLPNNWIQLDEFPTLSSGKIDRKKLSALL